MKYIPEELIVNRINAFPKRRLFALSYYREDGALCRLLARIGMRNPVILSDRLQFYTAISGTFIDVPLKSIVSFGNKNVTYVVKRREEENK